MHFQRRCCLKFLLPYGPICVSENESEKIKTVKKIGKKNQSGDMVKMYLATKFGINLHNGFWENGFTDDEQTDDGLPCDNSSSAVQ